MEPERSARSYLSAVVLGPCRAVADFVSAEGPVAAADAIRRGKAPREVIRRTQARAEFGDADKNVRRIAALSGRLCTPEDADWPAWQLLPFDAIDEAGPDHAPPLALWVVGSPALAPYLERAVAVVGTRAATSYGETVTAELVAGLVQAGWTVVSGGAYGIDASAHRSAVATAGSTVAVLAGGLDRPYPAGHGRLFRAIVDSTGLVISEYPPGTPPARHRFLARNRLLAALASASVVTEAGRRSGARNTVAWSRRLGKPTLAYPGPVTSAASVGTHHMISTGEARLVTCARDVLGEVSVAPTCDGATCDGRPEDALPHSALLVYEAFEGRHRYSEHELIFLSGLSDGDVRRALVHLELEGLAARDDDGWYRLS